MGGFEGGDEAGFWDIDTLSSLLNKQNDNRTKRPNQVKASIQSNDSGYSIKAHARVTLFLKITGLKDEELSLLSRFVRVEEVYDTISFVPCRCESFRIEGCDDIPQISNSIYKAYKALIDYTNDPEIEDFFHEHKVVVTKRIPLAAGLGGASSDAAAFMHLLKEVCNLVLSTDELVKIGRTLGSDVPFFIYNDPSANVSGLGEIVKLFEEEPLNIQLHTPDIGCDRAVVNKTFQEQLLANLSLPSLAAWENLDSRSILELTSDPVQLNDLYAAALLAYPDLQKEAKENWFFSASGPTFFKLL